VGIGLELTKSIEGVQNVVKYAADDKDVVDIFSPPMEHTELQNPEPPLQPTRKHSTSLRTLSSHLLKHVSSSVTGYFVGSIKIRYCHRREIVIV